MASSAGPSTRSVSPVVDDDLPQDYKPYVRVAKRRAQMLSKLGPGRHVSKKIKTTDELEEEKDALRALDEANEREREKARQQRTLLQEAQEVKRQKELEGESAADTLADSRCQQDGGAEASGRRCSSACPGSARAEETRERPRDRAWQDVHPEHEVDVASARVYPRPRASGTAGRTRQARNHPRGRGPTTSHRALCREFTNWRAR